MQRIQTSLATNSFRETDAISLATRFLPTDRKLNILSFGCSIGDELATLRIYFPNARIHGCDIDPVALATAEASMSHLAEVFLSSEEEIARRGPFDLICAFSSLCINPLPKLEIFQKNFPFSYFDEVVGMLDSNLRPGGIFATKNSSYPFTSARVACGYDRIRYSNIYQSGFIPVLNPNGNLALAVRDIPPASVFEIVDVSGLDDWDFIDCVFQKRLSPDAPDKVHSIATQAHRPHLPLEMVAQWTRSNLDTWGGGDLEKFVEIQQRFQIFHSPKRHGESYVEKTIFRQSIRTGEMMNMSVSGWWQRIRQKSRH